MFQGGVTDISTAKSVARKLYMQYCNGGQMERLAMERMLIDTYRIMVIICNIQNKQYQPTGQDLNLYNHILDFNRDGRVTIDDFEALAVKYLARAEKKYLSSHQEPIQRTSERGFKWPSASSRSSTVTEAATSVRIKFLN